MNSSYNLYYCVVAFIVFSLVGLDPTTTLPFPAIDSTKKQDSNIYTTVSGTVVGICPLVTIVFCTVVILILVLYLNDRRTQEQQQV